MADWSVKAKEILAKIKSYRDEKDDWKLVKTSVSYAGLFIVLFKRILGSHTGRTVPQGTLPHNP